MPVQPIQAATNLQKRDLPYCCREATIPAHFGFSRLIIKIMTRNFKKSPPREINNESGGKMRIHARIIVFGLCAFAMTFSYSAVATAQSGLASVYSGGRTASGEYAHSHGLTAAHRSLPFGTKLRVTNDRTGRSVVVRVNDRGPFTRGRVIDVTPAAARELGFSGVTRVSLEVVKEDGD